MGAGLVWGEELYFDATRVEANASLDSMRSRSLMEHGLEEHLAGIFPEDVLQPLEEGANTSEITAVGPAGQEGRALSEANAKRHRWIEEAGRQQREWFGGATDGWRIFSWLSQNRRMSKDYERLCASAEAFVYAAMVRLMVRRLARA